MINLLYIFPCLVSPRSSSSICPSSDAADFEFPGQHFQSDLLLLALGSSQRDLFENDWLDVMVRCYWLKARFLALQVKSILCGLFLLNFWLNKPFPLLSQMWLVRQLFLSDQGDMELALESYDVCVGWLQSKPKTTEGKHYTISLPNLRVDASISVEEVSVLNSYFQRSIIDWEIKCFHELWKRKMLPVHLKIYFELLVSCCFDCGILLVCLRLTRGWSLWSVASLWRRSSVSSSLLTLTLLCACCSPLWIMATGVNLWSLWAQHQSGLLSWCCCRLDMRPQYWRNLCIFWICVNVDTSLFNVVSLSLA